MRRETGGLLALFVLTLATSALPQEGSALPCPDMTSGALGCQLVAWSQLQEPVPLPEPDANKVPPQNDQQPEQRTKIPIQSTRQTFAGIILRQGDTFVLRAGDNSTYRLDDQVRARLFHGTRVKVVGHLATDRKTLLIEEIASAPRS